MHEENWNLMEIRVNSQRQVCGLGCHSINKGGKRANDGSFQKSVSQQTSITHFLSHVESREDNKNTKIEVKLLLDKKKGIRERGGQELVTEDIVMIKVCYMNA